MEFVLMFISLAVAGIFIGICSGLLGIGGGAVTIPLLRLVFGLDAYMAAATSLFTMIFTSFSGAVSHVRNKTCYPQLGVALGLGGSITSALGVYLGSISPAWAIILVASLIIFYSAYTMLGKALKLPKRGHVTAVATQTGHAAIASPTTDPTQADSAGASEFTLSHAKLLQGFGIGLIAGLSAGYVGVGGGFIMVPLMTAWLGVPMKKASGTSIVAIIILAIPGVIGQMLLGHVDYLAGIMLAVGSIPGAAIGARLIKRVNERQLRLLFAAFLLVAGILLIGNEFAQLA